jgi:hypothetical protein
MEVLSFQILAAIDGSQVNESKELLYRDVLIFFCGEKDRNDRQTPTQH